ncbi:MAG: hypothetical protein ACE5KV_00160 [Thermoplasmata archaeon]
MRKSETLLRVKEAEIEVEKMKRRATEEKERILREAKKEVLRIQEESKRKAEEALKERVAAGRKEIDARRLEILQRGQKDAEVIKQEGMGKIDAAVSLLLRRFEERVAAVSTERNV